MKKRNPTFKESIIMMALSLVIIIVGVLFLKLRTEFMLCIAAAVAALGAWNLGYNWNDLEDAISNRIGNTVGVLLILWSVGMVIGTFVFSGSIPMIIYYGLKIINPSFIYVSAFITCLIFSTITGSSYSSAGTAGVAFLGMAEGLGASVPITVGAAISGSIFGDKLSPLSETTNLASLCAGANIYDHIKSMLWTTIPPSIIACVVYMIMGRGLTLDGTAGIPQLTVTMLDSLDSLYNWSILLIIPFIIILYGSLAKKPTVPTLFLASLSAIGLGVIYQGFSLKDGFISAINGFNINMIYGGNVIPEISNILNRGGMTSMVSVILIVFCGYTFAAIASKAGFLDVALEPITNRIRTQTQLILGTLFTILMFMLAMGSCYVGFIIVSEMFREKYLELKVAPRVLSRSLEDIGTVTGALIPWGVSAAFYTATFGIPVFGTGGYGVWSILSYFSPLFAILYAITGIGVKQLNR